MTPPPLSPRLVRPFGRYLDRLFRGTFATVRWRSETDWHGWPADQPVLAIANHTSWWDGFLSHQVTRAIGRPFRILMEAEHLDRYRFFRRVGALPVERRSAHQALRDLEVAARCLTDGTMLWVYPQGMRRPAREPIAGLEHGAAWLLQHHAGPLQVVPVAMRYTFLSEQRPEAFALVGSPWHIDAPLPGARQAVTARLEEMLNAALGRLDADLDAEHLDRFDTLVTGKLSINNRLDRVRHALGLIPDHQVRNG